jgi:hypothetical protein
MMSSSLVSSSRQCLADLWQDALKRFQSCPAYLRLLLAYYPVSPEALSSASTATTFVHLLLTGSFHSNPFLDINLSLHTLTSLLNHQHPASCHRLYQTLLENSDPIQTFLHSWRDSYRQMFWRLLINLKRYRQPGVDPSLAPLLLSCLPRERNTPAVAEQMAHWSPDDDERFCIRRLSTLWEQTFPTESPLLWMSLVNLDSGRGELLPRILTALHGVAQRHLPVGILRPLSHWIPLTGQPPAELFQAWVAVSRLPVHCFPDDMAWKALSRLTATPEALFDLLREHLPQVRLSSTLPVLAPHLASYPPAQEWLFQQTLPLLTADDILDRTFAWQALARLKLPVDLQEELLARHLPGEVFDGPLTAMSAIGPSTSESYMRFSTLWLDKLRRLPPSQKWIVSRALTRLDGGRGEMLSLPETKRFIEDRLLLAEMTRHPTPSDEKQTRIWVEFWETCLKSSDPGVRHLALCPLFRLMTSSPVDHNRSSQVSRLITCLQKEPDPAVFLELHHHLTGFAHHRPDFPWSDLRAAISHRIHYPLHGDPALSRLIRHMDILQEIEKFFHFIVTAPQPGTNPGGAFLHYLRYLPAKFPAPPPQHPGRPSPPGTAGETPWEAFRKPCLTWLRSVLPRNHPFTPAILSGWLFPLPDHQTIAAHFCTPAAGGWSDLPPSGCFISTQVHVPSSHPANAPHPPHCNRFYGEPQ